MTDIKGLETLSTAGWIDGITASGVVLIGCIVGLFFIYKSRKLEAKLLFYLGLLGVLAGLAFLGVFLDFLIVLLTGRNMDKPYGIVGLLSYIWVAPLIVLAIHIGGELLLPKKKWFITSIYIVLMILFEVLLFLDMRGSFNLTPPSKPGEALIDYNLKLTSYAGFLMIIFIASVIIFLGIGFLIKGIQSTGALRKKFLLLSVGVFLYAVFGFLESLTEPGYLLIIIRIGYISGPIFMYFGLKG